MAPGATQGHGTFVGGPIRWVFWLLVGAVGAFGFAVIAGLRGDGGQVNAIWMIVAGLCTYTIAYRFYSRWIARRVFQLDDTRATPAEAIDNKRDFVPTNRFVLLGHHFAAIAGAGPLVGPVLAPRSATCPARCGSSSASCSRGPCRTSSSSSPRCAAAASRWAR